MPSAASAFYEQVIGLRPLTGTEDGGAAGRGGKGAGRADRDPSAPQRPPATTGLFHLAILVPSRLELGPDAAPGGKRGLALQRRLRPPGQRGPLPRRPGGERNRDLPRPSPGRVAGGGRRAAHGHPFPSTCRGCCWSCPTAARRRRSRSSRDWIGHAPGTSATLPRPRSSISAPSASRSQSAAIHRPCSSRRAATTTTSASTPGPARERRPLRAPAGCAGSRSSSPRRRPWRRSRRGSRPPESRRRGKKSSCGSVTRPGTHWCCGSPELRARLRTAVAADGG